MRCQPNESGRIHITRTIPCGQWVQMLGARSSYKRQQHCHRWSCDDCRAEKIMDLQFELRNSGLPLAAYVIEKPPAGTDTEIKTMSNFLTRKVPGKFWCLRSDERQVVISNKSFPAQSDCKQKALSIPLWLTS